MVAADDMDELVHAVKHAIQQCGLQVICPPGVHFVNASTLVAHDRPDTQYLGSGNRQISVYTSKYDVRIES